MKRRGFIFSFCFFLFCVLIAFCFGRASIASRPSEAAFFSAENESEGISGAALLSSVSLKMQFSEGAEGAHEVSGSGVILSLDRASGNAEIVTNHHLLFDENGRKAEKITVFLYGKELVRYGIDAIFLGGSRHLDCAVLQIRDSAVLRESEAQKAVFGNESVSKNGMRIFTVGNAKGRGISVTCGTVSRMYDCFLNDMSLPARYLFRIDAALNTGNSGGGVFDENGRIFGLVCSKDTENTEGIGYAIPFPTVCAVADSVMQNGGEARLFCPSFSCEVTASEVLFRENAVFVCETVTVAESQNGEIKVGDRISAVRVGDSLYEVTSLAQLQQLFLSVQKSQCVSVRVVRYGQTVTVSLPTGENTFVTVG